MSDVYKTDSFELRLGRWEDVLADVECDALIVDAPYSEKTHTGHDGASKRGSVGWQRDDGRIEHDGWQRRELTYGYWSDVDVRGFVDAWAPRTRGWFVTITDNILAPHWLSSLESNGLYVFSPLACVETGSRVRLTGDGPSQWTCWAIVARPKILSKWGTLPGAYVVPPGVREVGAARKAVIGGKSLWLMQSLIRDYTRPGDLVCDPCAGGGTTLLAAAIEGRRAIGAECMPEHFEIARKRLSKGFTRSMFADVERKPAPVQVSLLDEGDDK